MIQPNIIRGGKAIPFDYNLFLMKGRKHSQGGIDVGKDLEVEGGEVMQTSPNEIRVFSAQKFLGGESPANLVLKGANPNAVFAIQEQYKKENGINDDGTKKKAKNGIVKRFLNWIGNKGKTSPVEGDSLNFNGLKLTNGRAYTPEYLDSIYKGLVQRGMHKNQAIAVTGTAAEESGGDVYATSDDNEYTGILQWAGNRYKIQYPDDREKELNSQLDYIYDTLVNAEKRKKEGHNDDWTDGGKGSGYNSWKDAYKDFNDTTNVYNMTRGLNTGYVRPTGAIKGNNGSITNRMNATKQIFENNGITDLLYEPVKKKFGGMNNKQYNAQVLGYVPSTGHQRFASGGRKRALMGTDGKYYLSEQDMPIGVTPIVATDVKYDINPGTGLFEPKSYKIGDKTVDKVKSPYKVVETPKPKDEPAENKTPVKKKSIKEKLTDRYGAQGAGYFLGNGILYGASALTGLAGATANAISNAHYLNKMKSIVDSIKSYDIPLTSLKTAYNINPQLSEIERKLGLTTRDIDANTASSQVALARKRNARYNATAEKNKLYGQKENIETQLINQDLLQKGQTIAKNIENQQQIDMLKHKMNIDLLDKRSESETKMLETYAGILNQFANNGSNAIYNWLRYKAALAGNPNSVKAMENIL